MHPKEKLGAVSIACERVFVHIGAGYKPSLSCSMNTSFIYSGVHLYCTDKGIAHTDFLNERMKALELSADKPPEDKVVGMNVLKSST